MAISFAQVGTRTGAGSTTTHQITLSAGSCAVGDILVVLMAYDNSGGGGADPMSGQMSISGGYTGAAVSSQTGINDPGSASAGLACRCVAWPVTTAIPSQTVLDLSWSGSVSGIKSLVAWKATSNATLGFRTNSGATGTNALPLQPRH